MGEMRDKCKDCKYSDLCTRIRMDIQAQHMYRAMRLNNTLMETLEFVGYWMTQGIRPDIENIQSRLDAYACILQTIFDVDLNEIEGWYKNE